MVISLADGKSGPGLGAPFKKKKKTCKKRTRADQMKQSPSL